ncbi:amidohydrolase family protein [Streptomyces sp. A012304]|uniref:amidohydrolase family protein n=1 Tax=Streptomyces sp. A012304 TaxID=375446 RepID=UPI00222EA33D|nr:amidohydrolase family protein [Streptomyces sp. A012304]GKQ39962.1 amidohydrolase [Streptomyces sp. A012304]
MRKIALEEHFTTAAMEHYSLPGAAMFIPEQWETSLRRLLDFTEIRLPQMDEFGIDVEVLSLVSPGIQAEKDTATAVRNAALTNDFLAEIVAKHPKRFAGFAALALQDPDAAVAELDRAVTQLGLRGALINGHTHGDYLDAEKFLPLWERAEALGVPLYLHPANSFDTWHNLRGHEELIGPMWSWGVETATHALRIVFSGVFDRFPGATLVLGHMGESLPGMLWRLDSRWEFINRRGLKLGKERPSDYIRENIMITTSGVCAQAPLLGSLLALGADRIMFSTDYPMEGNAEAVAFIDNAPISETDRAKICHLNAERLLRL